jgi:hypothetical protein
MSGALTPSLSIKRENSLPSAQDIRARMSLVHSRTTKGSGDLGVPSPIYWVVSVKDTRSETYNEPLLKSSKIQSYITTNGQPASLSW